MEGWFKLHVWHRPLRIAEAAGEWHRVWPHEIAGGKSSRKIESFFVRNILENTDDDEAAVDDADWLAHEVEDEIVELQLLAVDVVDGVDDEWLQGTIDTCSSVIHLIKSSAEMGVILAVVVLLVVNGDSKS